MQQAYLESKPVVNGIVPKIICHLQRGNETGCSAHYHTYIELVYCLNGSFSVWSNNTHHDFYTGDLLVINSNEVHAIEARTQDGGAYIVLRFEPEVLYGSAKDAFDIKYVLPFMFNSVTPQKIFKYEEIYNTEIPRLMHDAYDEYISGKFGFELALRSDICRIFLWILRYWEGMGINIPTSNVTASEHIKSLKHVLDYISAHYNENISANDMARLANMSYTYFLKVFGKVMNKSFTDYLSFIRITEAEKLLVSTNMTITEIAYDTGFSSSSYFIKIFSKYKSMSPSQFRKKFLQESAEITD